MQEILAALLNSIQAGRPAAYCRLVETRGSTPQKPGAAMLVFPDGSQAGTLGGGCVEAEVKRRALAALEDGKRAIHQYQLDDDYGWDDGLICGGRMQILVDPVREAAQVGYFQRLADLARDNRGGVEAIVFDASLNGLSAPSSYLFDSGGQLVAVQPAGSSASDAPDLVRLHLPPLEQRPKASAAQGIAFLPLLPRCRLVIVGGGHVGKAVAELAAELDFDVWVVDDRSEYVSPLRFPRAQRRLCGEIASVLSQLDIDRDTYCLIVTRGHQHDEQALFCLAQRGARYVGMIGSRRKIKLIFDDLVQEGIPRDVLSRVHAPVGLDIGSQTVAEIAVSICAELVAHRNLGRAPGRPKPVNPSGS